LIRQEQIQAGEWEERQRQLEQENRRRQEQARDYERQLALLREPQPNVPTYTLFSQAFALRSGGSVKTASVRVPPTARTFILTLHGGGQPEYYSDYAIEITEAKDGPTRWRKSGLQRDHAGNFVLALERTFLHEGTYHCKISGQRHGRPEPIAEYVLRLEL